MCIIEDNVENMDKVMDDKREILFFALHSGELMLSNGGEIYRVEDIVLRICNARKIKNINVFATPTMIMVAYDKGENFCIFKRIISRNTDLKKVSMINDLVRKFTSTDMQVSQAEKTLDEIDQVSQNKLHKFLFAGIASGCFSILFGGDIKDFFVAFFIGTIAEIFYEYINVVLDSQFLANIFAGCIIGLIASVSHKVLFSSLDTTIIGSIMPFVPGVVLTSSVRDFMHGDLLSGSSRFFEAILIATSIAFGVATSISLVRGI